MGNPNEHGGYYFVDYGYHAGSTTVNREKGSFRHYLHYLAEGTAVYYTEQGPFHVRAGDFFYLPMDISYTSQLRDRHIISCGFTHFPEALDHTFLPQKLPDRFIPQFLEIPKNIAPDSATLAMFYSLLSQLLPYMKAAETDYAATLAEKLRIFMWRHYRCQVKDMADYCRMSVPNLYRVLKESGCGTPNGLKQEILIQKAMLWLADTNNSVEEISAELGFSSTNYFRKIFKAHTGKSPREYRKETKNHSNLTE